MVVGSGQPELFSVSITRLDSQSWQWTARAVLCEYNTVVGTVVGSGQPELFSVSITWLLAADSQSCSL